MNRGYSSLGVVAIAAMLSLSLAAQTSGTQTTPPANTTSSSAGAQATSQPATATGEQPLAAPVKQGFWGRLNPFARKKYVNNQMAPIRDRVNELDGLTDDNSKAIADTDARAKMGIHDAQDKAQQAAQTASAAQQQVQQDSDQAQQLNTQVSSVNSKVQGVDQYQVAQTADLHFKPGPAKLSPDTESQLSSFLNGLSNQKGYLVEVTAYSSRKGAAGDAASQQLADAVVRYMVLQQNIPLYRIYTMGMGSATPAQMNNSSAESASSGARATQGGTVEIKVLKNSLAENGTSGPAQ